MSVIEKIMNETDANADLLRSLESKGDDFRKFRAVDFFFNCPSKEKAELVAGFINDYQYGKATPTENSGGHQIRVIIDMPISQNIISSICGFMVCVAELYGLEFSGWGCIAQQTQHQ